MNTKHCTPSERKTLKRLARKERRRTGMSMHEAEQEFVRMFGCAMKELCSEVIDTKALLPQRDPTTN